MLGYTGPRAQSLVLRCGRILLLTVAVPSELAPCFENAPLHSSKCLCIIQTGGSTIYLQPYLICFSLKYSKKSGHPIKNLLYVNSPSSKFLAGGCFMPLSAEMEQVRGTPCSPTASAVHEPVLQIPLVRLYPGFTLVDFM